MGSRTYKRNSKKSDELGDSVSDYLRRTGLWLTESQTAFNERIESELGSDFSKGIERARMQHAAGNTAPAYDLLSRNLETTRLTATMGAPHIRKWLSHWSKLRLPDGDLLDLGCGAGLMTCFYALSRPGSRVVGIDRSPSAIERGQELAASLGLTNVSFVCSDVLGLPDELDKFAVVVSTVLLHELESQFLHPQIGFSTLRVLPELLNGTFSSSLAALAAALLVPGGRYVSVERLPGSDSTAAWMGALGRSGLGVDLGQSSDIAFQFFGLKQRLPVVIAGTELERVRPEAFIRWANNHPLPPDIGPDTFVEECRFRQSEPFEFVAGWEIVLAGNPPPQVRFVVVTDNRKNVLAYETSTLGWRRIRARGRSRDLDRIVSETADHCHSFLEAPGVMETWSMNKDDEF